MPTCGEHFDNPSPVTGKTVYQVARGTAEDIELALDAAHRAKEGWGRTSSADRARVLLRIADRMEEKLSLLALTEAIDHFRHFVGCLRAQEGALSEIDHDTVAYHFHEPPGVVGQIIPRHFPPPMAV